MAEPRNESEVRLLAESWQVSKNNGFRGAYVKGAVAAFQGKSTHSCPYDRFAVAPVRGKRVVPTWERSFANYWMDGFKHMKTYLRAGEEPTNA